MRVPFKAASIVQAQLDPDVGLVGADTLIYHSIEQNKLLLREKVMVGSC